MKKKYRQILLVSIMAALIVIVVSTILYVNNNLPNTIFVNSNESTKVNFSIPVSLNKNEDSSFNISGENKINSGDIGEYEYSYKLFGILSLKKSRVKVVEKTYVYPSGVPIGLYLKTQGVMIIDAGEVQLDNNKKTTPLKGKIQSGEYIIKFNDINVSNKSQLAYLINENGSKKINLTIKNGNELRQMEVSPVKNNKGEYVIGIWVRDDSQGLGTMTFVTEDNKYAALGHGISDIDTGKMLSSHDGNVYNANIWGIKKGVSGNPGGLCGNIIYNNENLIGDIQSNNSCGIYGRLNDKSVDYKKAERMEIGFQSEVKEGRAKVCFAYNGTYKLYDIKIVEINKNNKDKNMVVEIVDKELLELTNGIVQGMSGCPIIQDNKVIGAVTHVMVNDPTKGYAIFAENMLEKCIDIK